MNVPVNGWIDSYIDGRIRSGFCRAVTAIQRIHVWWIVE